MARHPSVPAPATAGEVLRCVLDGAADTRTDLGRVTGLSRSAVTARVNELISHGLLVEQATGPSTGGRPPGRLRFNARGGIVLTASVGFRRSQLAACDLAGTALTESSGECDVAQGPDVVLPWLVERWREQLDRLGVTSDTVRGIGLALPTPVDVVTARTASPAVIPGWDGVSLRGYLTPHFDVPVLVDNDVNVLAIGEHWYRRRDAVTELLYVKISTGIGAGIIAGGQVQRGALGAAGEIGHIRVADGTGAACWCGAVDCLGAVAGGAALARRVGVDGLADVVDLVRAGDPGATAAVRDAGRRVGEVLAAAINLLNPAVVVLGGDLARAHEPLLAGVRESVYQRATAYATSHLTIVPSTLDERAAQLGCAVMVLDRILAPAAIDAALTAPATGAAQTPGARIASQRTPATAPTATAAPAAARPGP